jgi:hypothetical protein
MYHRRHDVTAMPKPRAPARVPKLQMLIPASLTHCRHTGLIRTGSSSVLYNVHGVNLGGMSLVHGRPWRSLKIGDELYL